MEIPPEAASVALPVLAVTGVITTILPPVLLIFRAPLVLEVLINVSEGTLVLMAIEEGDDA